MGCRGRAGTCTSLAVLLCLAIGWSSPTAATARAAIAQPDYSVYLKKDQLLQKVQELAAAHPETMKLEMRHAKDGDYSADLVVITVEPGGISPSHPSKARLLLDFGEHGREFITSEVALRLMQVLPMENVHGRDLVEAGQLCERKNGRGVDTNRNWDIDWGKKEKDYDPKEEFPGRAPLSEPEVQILLALAKELKPHLWLNVHSGMYALFTPYDHKPSVPNDTNAQAALRMMQRIKDLSCPTCVVGSGGHSVGYLAHGTGTDYMFEVLGVPMSFTWEIYGDSSAAYEDCFKMFNPEGKERFEEVVTLWTKALLQLLELLPSHPATWPQLPGGYYSAVYEEPMLEAAASAAHSNSRAVAGEDADGVKSLQSLPGQEAASVDEALQTLLDLLPDSLGPHLSEVCLLRPTQPQVLEIMADAGRPVQVSFPEALAKLAEAKQQPWQRSVTSSSAPSSSAHLEPVIGFATPSLLARSDNLTPHPCIGRARRMMVPHREQQAQVLVEAIQNHAPDCIIVDEIGTRQEVAAARTIAQRGVLLVGTAHGIWLSDLLRNPDLRPLVGGVESVTLGDEEARISNNGVKTRLERAGAATFTMLLELQERHR
eukprot:gene5541-5777_t